MSAEEKPSGLTDLREILKTLQPSLCSKKYVYCTLDINQPDNHDFLQKLMTKDADKVVCQFREPEGLTLVVEHSLATRPGYDAYLPFDFVCAWITLKVHSSLEAVGLTAEFSRVLSQNQISCNVIAGFYHDHIFVDYQDKDRAMDVLKDLARGEHAR